MVSEVILDLLAKLQKASTREVFFSGDGEVRAHRVLGCCQKDDCLQSCQILLLFHLVATLSLRTNEDSSLCIADSDDTLKGR